MRIERADRSLPVEVVPRKFCPRKLVPGQVKRYLFEGPLAGYMVACPGCGFSEMHIHEQVGFVEEDGKPIRTEGPRVHVCLLCRREVRFVDGKVEAKTRAQDETV